MERYMSKECSERINCHFEALYGSKMAEHCLERFAMLLGRYGVGAESGLQQPAWSEKSLWLIVYGDMISEESERPLQTLGKFLKTHFSGIFSAVHVLPFFPYSSDDGFSITNYRQVNPNLGNWRDLEAIAENFELVVNLVLNHVSRESSWFRDYVLGIYPAANYFVELDPKTDLAAVARPCNTALLSPVMTRNGQKYVWTTFSSDQVDLNFKNPDVLFEFFDLLLFYISKGARAIKLDAVDYLWKNPGTSCCNLPETHVIVKLLRELINLVTPQVVLLSEVNNLARESSSYCAHGDQAHLVSQLALPGLILHTLLSGCSTAISLWARKLQKPPGGSTYFNFTASHDGILIDPLDGILTEDQIAAISQHVLTCGGQISTRADCNGVEEPYELNIAYFDALMLPEEKKCGELQIARFICSQAIALALQGVPAIYFNNLFGSSSDQENYKLSGQARALNRKKWRFLELSEQLYGAGRASIIFRQLMQIFQARAGHPAFDPDAPQTIMDFGEEIFAVERVDIPSKEAILCLHNVTSRAQEICLATRTTDLISGAHLEEKFVLKPYQVAWLR